VNREQRTKIWVDHFQTRLTVRIVLYLGAFLLVLTNLLFALTLIEDGPRNLIPQFVGMVTAHAPVLLCLFALTPVIAWDAVRFTHRLVGPLARFRRAFRDITAGQLVQLIRLRQGDFLDEFRDEFNDMLLSLERRGITVLKPHDPSSIVEPPQRTSA
jgi:hypothetical protein